MNHFEEMNYYIIDIDLPEDSSELGNDPFYSLYLLDDENIISLSTQVGVSCNDIKENPLMWGTRIVALVYSNKELLEDAFYNFLEDVTIYPLSMKSLLSSELEPQSNELILDFINDFKDIASSNSFDKLPSILEAVEDIINPKSLQGFLFSRLNYILSNNKLSNGQIKDILEYIFAILDLDITISDQVCEETCEEVEEIKEEVCIEDEEASETIEEHVCEEVVEEIFNPEPETSEVVEEVEEIKEEEPKVEAEPVSTSNEDEDIQPVTFDFDLDTNEKNTLFEILSQQKDILANEKKQS